MPVRVSVDPELCIGSGDCGRLLPGAFQIEESLGVSVPLSGAAAADVRLLLRARAGCPTHAIAIDDENGDPIAEAVGGR
jgi:ferredoxin